MIAIKAFMVCGLISGRGREGGYTYMRIIICRGRGKARNRATTARITLSIDSGLNNEAV
jgi:hypothetical protein